MNVIVVSDGSAIPNPGRGALGCLIAEADTRGLWRVWLAHRLLEGRYTNNEAEYRAAVLGLELARERCPESALTLMVDSELLVKQVRGEYRTAVKFRPWRDAIIAAGCGVEWHTRESVTGRIADLLSRGDVLAARVAIDDWVRRYNERDTGVSTEIEYIMQGNFQQGPKELAGTPLRDVVGERNGLRCICQTQSSIGRY